MHSTNLLRMAHPGRPQTLISDIDKYLDSPPIEWDADDSLNYIKDWVLDWWKVHKLEFPLMAQAA